MRDLPEMPLGVCDRGLSDSLSGPFLIFKIVNESVTRAGTMQPLPRFLVVQCKSSL
jgi:hypothetical protein